MIPFLRLGPILVPTFGLMIAAAMAVAYCVLRADMARRGLEAKDTPVSRAYAPGNPSLAEMFVAVPALIGIVGAKLYHVLETPRELLADPIGQIFSRYGLAWFGGLIAGFGAFVWLARRHKIPLLEMFDAGSAAAAIGYGIGRIGCLLSGDGDYGTPTSLPWGMSFPHGLVPTTDRVHPTPIYELIAACAIAGILWRLGTFQVKPRRSTIDAALVPGPTLSAAELERARAKFEGAAKANPQPPLPVWRRLRLQWKMMFMRPPIGSVFAAYLILTGVARFFVEFIRINPRSFLGLTNAQAASVVSVIAGAALWWHVARKSPPKPSVS